jgi:cytoskeleton protein RodZ
MAKENTETTVNPSLGLPGSLLRQAREEKGLTIEEMSAISNLTKQVIRGIESDDYSELAGLSFVRGYLKLYAKKLGVNESDVVEPFDRWKAEQSGEPVQTSSSSGISVQEPSSGPSQGMIIAAGVLVVVLISVGSVISYMDSAKSEPEVSAVLPKSESSGVSVVTPPEPSKEMTADQNSDQTVSVAAEKDSEPSLNGSIETQTPVVETATESPAGAEPEQFAQAELVQIEKQPEPEKAVEPVEQPKVVKKVEPKVETVEKVEERIAEKVENNDEKPILVSPSNLNQGARVIAEASGLSPALTGPVQTTQVSPGQDDGLRVLSETVTGPSSDQLAMGAQGRLEIVFTGDSWVEIRDARGRLVLADLMTPEKVLDFETYGPIELLVGAVSVSTVTFNGETQDLKKNAYQDVARITLGAETN